ncbi:MAG: hypothetical protein Ta2F_04980 [Termitinemataceae bacterium]|nr:MAG: hypothetical protein Ta2F_04980 [Termitinemataceae bacterium]
MKFYCLPISIFLNFCISVVLISCTSNNKIVKEMPIVMPSTAVAQTKSAQPATIPAVQNPKINEINILVEGGKYSQLQKALTLIEEYGFGETEYGRLTSAIAVTLLIDVYNETKDTLPRPRPPQTETYAKILSAAAQGDYRTPPYGCSDYLELTLPFLAFINIDSQTLGTEYETKRINSDVIDNLKKAVSINPSGIIAAYFLGLAYEKTGKPKEAQTLYASTLKIDEEFFPAMLGNARILHSNDEDDSVVAMFTELMRLYPNNFMIQRHLAEEYFWRQNWQQASELFDNVLKSDQHNAKLLLKQTRTQIELKNYIRAQMLLDTYNSENPEKKESRFLLARLQYEGFKNKESALAIMRQLNKNNSGDYEFQLYLARILIESADIAEQNEGRTILKRLMNYGSLDVLELAASDAVRRSSWQEARDYQQRILPQRRNSADLLNSFSIEQGLGNKQNALVFARELRNKYPENEDGNIAYITALIENGRETDALDLIDKRLAILGTGSYKSRYYFLRSRLKTDDAALSDLRSSIFENPRNVDALKAIFEIYHNNGDEKRAVYYLRQAAALSPNDPDVIQYQKKYAGKP